MPTALLSSTVTTKNVSDNLISNATSGAPNSACYAVVSIGQPMASVGVQRIIP